MAFTLRYEHERRLDALKAQPLQLYSFCYTDWIITKNKPNIFSSTATSPPLFMPQTHSLITGPNKFVEWDHSMIDFVEVPDYTTEGVFDEICGKRWEECEGNRGDWVCKMPSPPATTSRLGSRMPARWPLRESCKTQQS